VARVGDRCVGEGLSDDAHLNAADVTDRVSREHLIAEVRGLDVLRHEIDLAPEVLLDDLRDPLHAIGHLPVRRHHVHTEQLAGVDHVLRIGPQRSARALPGVAAVQQ